MLRLVLLPAGEYRTSPCKLEKIISLSSGLAYHPMLDPGTVVRIDFIEMILINGHSAVSAFVLPRIIISYSTGRRDARLLNSGRIELWRKLQLVMFRIWRLVILDTWLASGVLPTCHRPQ